MITRQASPPEVAGTVTSFPAFAESQDVAVGTFGPGVLSCWTVPKFGTSCPWELRSSTTYPEVTKAGIWPCPIRGVLPARLIIW